MRKRICGLLALATICGALAVMWWATPPVPPVPPDDDPDIHGVRTLAKWAIASEVAGGRMSLPEGAAVFGWLDRLPPGPSDPRVCLEKAADKDDFQAARTEADFLCLSVLVYVSEGGRSKSSRLPEIRSEFRRACAAPSGADLPAVNETDCREFVARARAAWFLLCTTGSSGARAQVDVGGLRLVDRSGK
jgi:hypothetical protein